MLYTNNNVETPNKEDALYHTHIHIAEMNAWDNDDAIEGQTCSDDPLDILIAHEEVLEMFTH